MFDHTSWICPACSVGISVPKSSPTSSYLSPRHFIAASIMSGSWPMILLGLFGSRYMIGGSVGSRPTFMVLPASPGYLVATLSGSHVAPASPAVDNASAPTTTPAHTAPRISRITPSIRSRLISALQRRSARPLVAASRGRAAPREMPAPAGAAQELPVARDDLAP